MTSSTARTDKKTLLIQSSSPTSTSAPITSTTRRQDKLQKLGTAYPELDQNALGYDDQHRLQGHGRHRDPGLSHRTDRAPKRKNLPLIVMPHDGPVARDSWKFSFLRTFLANRGYAVLQMNYRGSAGFGQKWRLDAHQDWGGLTYSDIQDATRWAVQRRHRRSRSGSASWAGDSAATRPCWARRATAIPYRCAVSIAGIADLEMYQEHGAIIGSKELPPRTRSAPTARNSSATHRCRTPRRSAFPCCWSTARKDWQVQDGSDQRHGQGAGADTRSRHELVHHQGRAATSSSASRTA